MKSIFRFLTAAAVMMLPVVASAQENSDPHGYLTYSLPSTTIVLDVEAVQETFYAGPYAKYAEKYLGIKARQKDETLFQITEVTMSPFIEADQSRRYSINVEKGTIDGSFMRLSSEGLISFSDAWSVEPYVWRFPTENQKDFSGKGIASNMTSASATLYHNDETFDYDKVSIMQNMLVGKTLEQRAAEAAEMILNLRTQRFQIVTGDTDATYSGEAMGAAIAEITRLEEEYLTLFIGYSDYQTQKMRFEVIPSAEQAEQMYIAFRLSDTDGLVPADNYSGKPVTMWITAQQFAQTADQVVVPKDKKGNEVADKVKKDVMAYYRIPAICTVKLMDGVNVLLQSRLPIYQLGQESSIPVNVILK